MIVIATGNYRTGSTLAYNIARELCNEYVKNFEVIQYGYTNEELIDLVHKDTSTRVYILKSHDYLPEKDFPDLKCIHTTRNMLDAVASSIVLKNTELTTEVCDSIKHQHERDVLVQSYVNRKYECIRHFKYEDFYGNLRKFILDIASYLGFMITDGFLEFLIAEYDVTKIKETYSHFEAEHDLTRWFRPNHVSYYNGMPGFYKEILTQEQIDKIQELIQS